jgi:predicted DNA-binding protein (MmcQ/YjbR family)
MERESLGMTAEELRDACLEMPLAEETFPFGPETHVFKVGGKIFAISGLRAESLSVSLKVDPEVGQGLRESHEAVEPGYHLNKKHWITVTVGGDVPDDQIRDLIQDSHDLVRPHRRRGGIGKG